MNEFLRELIFWVLIPSVSAGIIIFFVSGYILSKGMRILRRRELYHYYITSA